MSTRRFFVEPGDVAADVLRLQPDEARHAERVLRLAPGTRITCFDGRGSAWHGTIASFDSRGATIVDLERVDLPIEPGPRLHLAQSIIKNDAMDLVVQKTTELGIASITPVLAERCDVRRDAERASRRVERWRKIVREAAKQCERNTLPVVGEPVGLDDAIANARGRSIALAERDGSVAADVLAALNGADDVTLFVGPEGGWTEHERATFRAASCPLASLGPMILRAETAAIAAVSIARFALARDRRS